MACTLSQLMYSIYVCVNGSDSNILSVSSGVPQGSVLGPLLFIIYINDITDVHLSDYSMIIYADDIILYRPIHTPPDYEFMQQDIDKLCTWTSNNLLKFNSIKCKNMVISRKRLPFQHNTSLTVNHLLMKKVQS